MSRISPRKVSGHAKSPRKPRMRTAELLEERNLLTVFFDSPDMMLSYVDGSLMIDYSQSSSSVSVYMGLSNGNVTLGTSASTATNVWPANGQGQTWVPNNFKQISIVGTNFDDTIDLSGVDATFTLLGDRDITIDGGAGNDTITGSELGDSIVGGSGGDTIHGQGGRDILFGGTGADTLKGGDESDELFGEDGADHLWGEAGNDILQGGTGDDNLEGGVGEDVLLGQEGDDDRDGGAGVDRSDHDSADSEPPSDTDNNHAPIIEFIGSGWDDTSDGELAVFSGEPLALQVQAVDPDHTGEGFPLTYSISLPANMPGGTPTIDSDSGQLTWTPPAGTPTGTYNATATVTDDLGASTSESFDIKVLEKAVRPHFSHLIRDPYNESQTGTTFHSAWDLPYIVCSSYSGTKDCDRAGDGVSAYGTNADLPNNVHRFRMWIDDADEVTVTPRDGTGSSPHGSIEFTTTPTLVSGSTKQWEFEVKFIGDDFTDWPRPSSYAADVVATNKVLDQNGQTISTKSAQKTINLWTTDAWMNKHSTPAGSQFHTTSPPVAFDHVIAAERLSNGSYRAEIDLGPTSGWAGPGYYSELTVGSAANGTVTYNSATDTYEYLSTAFTGYDEFRFSVTVDQGYVYRGPTGTCNVNNTPMCGDAVEPITGWKIGSNGDVVSDNIALYSDQLTSNDALVRIILPVVATTEIIGPDEERETRDQCDCVCSCGNTPVTSVGSSTGSPDVSLNVGATHDPVKLVQQTLAQDSSPHVLGVSFVTSEFLDELSGGGSTSAISVAVEVDGATADTVSIPTSGILPGESYAFYTELNASNVSTGFRNATITTSQGFTGTFKAGVRVVESVSEIGARREWDCRSMGS